MATVSAREFEVLLRAFNLEHPGLVLSYGFLKKTAIIDGLRGSTTNQELATFFQSFGDVRAVVADEEGYRGERLGLVVFPDAGTCSAAVTQTSDHYESIVKVDSTHVDRGFLIKAVRRPNIAMDRIQFRNVRNLMGVLGTVNPEVVEDPRFLERSVLLIGLSSETTPGDLIKRRFGGKDVDAAVIVRDPETSQRLGLVVFARAEDATVDKNWKPDPNLYRRCIHANSFCNVQKAVLEGSEDSERRKGTAATMRSLIPTQYLQNGDSTDFHLRCLLLRRSRLVDLSQGPYNLCRIAEQNQLASGMVCAAVLSEALNAAILVYDDPQSTDQAYRSAPRLRAGSLMLYDSSLFPMPTGEVTGVPNQLLPEFFTKPEYLGRVVSIRGIPPEKCDVRELAYYFTGFKLEALFVHRAQRQVFAVFGSGSDVHEVRSRQPKAWGKLCGWRIWFEDLDDAYFQPTEPAPAQQQEVDAQPYPGVPEEVIEMAEEELQLRIALCSSGDSKGIAEGLIRLAAVSGPDVLLHKYFLDRAVLLWGIHAGASESDLRSVLCITFGEIDLLVVNSEQGVALAVFKSWKASAKLRQQPPETLRRFGVGHCELIPEEVVVATLVSDTSDMVQRYHYRIQHVCRE